MMWHTHAAIGAGATWPLMPLLSHDSGLVAIVMVCCVIGTLVPDLDAVESKIKHVKVMDIKPLVPVSRTINREFGHRGLLHSLRGWVGWTILILPLGIVIGWLSVAILSLGYASHLAADACTKTGIPLLYPQKAKWHLLPKRLRIVTGSDAEEIVFVLAAMLTLMLLLTQMSS